MMNMMCGGKKMKKMMKHCMDGRRSRSCSMGREESKHCGKDMKMDCHKGMMDCHKSMGDCKMGMEGCDMKKMDCGKTTTGGECTMKMKPQCLDESDMKKDCDTMKKC